MRRILASVMTGLLLLSLCACGNSAAKWQEQYDLGVRYLSDGNYEEAIIAFTAAIEIDPRGADAYIGLANVYIEKGDFDAALEVLQRGYDQTGDQLLQDKIDEIRSGNVNDYLGRRKKMTGFDAEGNVQFWHMYSYEGSGNNYTIRSYDKDGNETGVAEYKEDAEGRAVADYYSTDGTGEVGQTYYEYDKTGNCIKSTLYDLNDQPFFIIEYEHDTSGRVIKKSNYLDGELSYYETFSYEDGIEHLYRYHKERTQDGGTDFALSGYFVYLDDGEYWYDPEGNLQYYNIWIKDDAGNTIGSERYDANGVLQSSTRYD